MDDYTRVTRVIEYLEARHTEQPDLATLAQVVELSPAHFHRLFVQWAGVTPKDFLQCLTLEHARSLLRRGESVLDTALQTGLSGPGRLHDLCVSLEAASPGEMKSGGWGWTMVYGVAATPFGQCALAESPRGLCVLSFIDPEPESQVLEEMNREWPQARWLRDDRVAESWAARIFIGREKGNAGTSLKVFVRGTPFQVRVWQALLRIPTGTLTTYGELAARVGNPTASRAVGSAVGANPLSYLIPCHRVIRGTGVIGEYRWGHLRKRALIAQESARW